VTVDSRMPAYAAVPEPNLAFHSERPSDCDPHPLIGLAQHGPYSRSLPHLVLDPIRIAVIAPNGMLHPAEALIAELETRPRPRERPQYLVEFPGFSRTFGVRAVLADQGARLELPAQLDQEISRSSRPHQVLAARLTQALSTLQTRRSEFDVVLLLLADRWSAGFWGPEDEDFDLHDYLKAITAARGIPMQIVQENSALKYFCRCSVMWRLSIAFYTKAGGIPWKLADAPQDTAFIGLSYAIRPQKDASARFVTCCSQVFDADGVGLEFIAYESSDVHVERDNPFLSRAQMRSVMARSLLLYQQRHAGRPPRRVVIHKTTEFKREEVDGCFDAWLSAEGLDLIQVQQDTLWHGVLLSKKAGQDRGQPEPYPCVRGTYLPLGGREVLLWTQGNAPSAVGGKNYYKEGKGIPTPLLLQRFAGHGAWDETCRAVVGLSKMNWNNDGLYDRLPVTMGYAQILARIVKRMPHLGTRPYQVRFFM
jgi:hypothetical protein